MHFKDSDIESRVTIIASFLLKDTKLKEEDKIVIKSAVELITNLLQNINDIADASV